MFLKFSKSNALGIENAHRNLVQSGIRKVKKQSNPRSHKVLQNNSEQSPYILILIPSERFPICFILSSFLVRNTSLIITSCHPYNLLIIHRFLPSI